MCFLGSGASTQAMLGVGSFNLFVDTHRSIGHTCLSRDFSRPVVEQVIG